MPEFVLYHTPGACSKVTVNALEEIGVEYEDHVIDLMKGEQKKPEYLAINPKGKVPAFLISGQLLTETPAILYYLHQRFPEAALLPKVESDYEKAVQFSDLCWCSSGFHIMVRQVRMPIRFTLGETEGVKACGTQYLDVQIADLNKRLSQQSWWYGDQWSIIDVYLYWCYSVAASADYDLSRYPAIVAHQQRLGARPSFQRAEQRLAQARQRAGMAE